MNNVLKNNKFTLFTSAVCSFTGSFLYAKFLKSETVSQQEQPKLPKK